MNLKSAIQAEQLRQMFSAYFVSLATSILLAAILAYIQQDAIQPAVVWLWFAFTVAVMLVRGWLAGVYQRSAGDDEASIQRWLTRFRIGVGAAAGMWGAAGIFLFPENDPLHLMFLVCTLVGLSAGGVISYAPDRVSAIIFSVMTLSPIIINLFKSGDSVSSAMAVAAILYLTFIILSLRHVSRHIRDNIVLNFAAIQREQDMKASEERYRLLLSHSPIGIFHYDTGLIVTYCNQRFAEILHSSPERLIGQDMNLLENKIILPAMKMALVGEVGYYDGLYRTLPNVDGWIDMTCAPSLNNEGKIMGGIAIVQDSSERKLAEQELRIAATAFETQEGIVITDHETRILRVNRAFTRLTGYSAEEALGQTPRLLRSDRQEPAFYQAMWNALNSEGYWEGEIWNRRKNGEIFPEWLAISVVKDMGNQVSHYVAVFSDITLRKQDEAKIHNLAFYDHLTQLPNRRLLMDRLNHTIAAVSRNATHGALLFIDLDNFKILNDTKGHAIGDQLLIDVARRLQDCIRSVDTVARQGGDEFVILLDDLSADTAIALAQADAVGEKIRAALNQPFVFEDFVHNISSSVGISLFKGDDNNVHDLLKRADTAMYEAKNSGRNRVRFFDPAMQAAIEKRVSLEADLRQAIAGHQFKLYFQKQVNAQNHLIGAESLVRWEHPKRGMVSPLDFVPLAEETGLILAIGEWVLETACKQIKAWENNPLTRHLQLAVNVSARQFHQPNFTQQVHEVIQRTGINSGRLKLELTESVVLDDIDDTITKMRALKAIGVRFSMDDFGTGYSSLAYLTQLPLDQLKIDRSFVRNIGVKPTDAVVVQTIISMGRNLNMEVVAEGVETKEQLEFLALYQCDAYQGFLFGKPQPLDEFEASFIRSA